MGDKSKIQWTDATLNPVTGCTPIAAGCKNCYAKDMHKRLTAMGSPKYQHPFNEVQCHSDVMAQALRWKKPRRIFINSMSDLFHEDVPAKFIYECFRVMSQCPQHTFQILTKRPDRMAYIALQVWGSDEWNLDNVWLGYSASNQKDLDEGSLYLLETPAAVRFLSLEPLCGTIDLSKLISDGGCPACADEAFPCSESSIDLVIVGAESGANARPMDLNWVRSIRDQCVAAGTPFFFKQQMVNGKMVNMPELDGKVWDQLPKEKTGDRDEQQKNSD